MRRKICNVSRFDASTLLVSRIISSRPGRHEKDMQGMGVTDRPVISELNGSTSLRRENKWATMLCSLPLLLTKKDSAAFKCGRPKWCKGQSDVLVRTLDSILFWFSFPYVIIMYQCPTPACAVCQCIKSHGILKAFWHSDERREPTASYRWTYWLSLRKITSWRSGLHESYWLSLRNTRLKFTTSGEL